MPPKHSSGPSATAHPCSKCTKSFSSATALVQHCRSTRHGHQIPMVSCTIAGCTKAFMSQQALEQHVNSGIHKDVQTNRPQVSTQHIHTSSVQKEPRTSNQKASAADGNTSTRDDEPRSSETAAPVVKLPSAPRKGNAAGATVKGSFPTVAGSTSNDICRGSLEPTSGSATLHTPPVREAAKTCTLPSLSRSNTELRGKAPSLALPSDEMPQPTRNASLHGDYALYDIKNCYLVATPRNGGESVGRPLLVDYSGGDLDFAVLLPTSQQQAICLGPSVSCKTCGLVFTSCESLTSHFKSSACSTLPTPLPKAGSVNLLQALHEPNMPGTRTTPGANTPQPQSGMESNTQGFRPQPKERWSVIPEPQRHATLAALTAICHSTSTLTKNKYVYPPEGGYARIPREAAALSTIPLPSPIHDPQVPKRGAVALDCEMVGVGKGRSELARLSAIDCLTGEVLIDTLVQPTQPVTDWRTKFSGITKKAMTAAVAEDRVLKGWPRARARLWEHIDTSTILIGQALRHDLEVLRMQHWRIVDSAILAKEAVGPGVARQWGLKLLCHQLLGVEIQSDTKRGHDSVEDAFAAREVVLWCISHPNELASWGARRKEEYVKRKQVMEARRGKSARKKAMSYRSQSYHTDDEDKEIFSLEEMAEELGWPPGYDPWSD